MKQQIGRVGRLINARGRHTSEDSPITIFPLSAPVAPNALVTLSWSCLDSNSPSFCDQAFLIAETLVPTPTDSILASEHILDVHQVLATVNPAHNSTFIFTVAPEGEGIFELVASLAATGTDSVATIFPGPTITVLSAAIIPSSPTSANLPVTEDAGSSSPSLQTTSVPDQTFPDPSPATSPNSSVTGGARSSSSPKLKIILPSVAGSLVLLAIIFTIMFCCYRRTKRPRSTTMSHVVRDAESSTSDPNIIHPYDLKTDDQVLRSRIPELFPGEPTQARPNDLDSIAVGRRGIFERLLWRNGINRSELPRPYELKEDLLPLANQGAVSSLRLSIPRPRPSSRPRPIARSIAQTESTERQIRLREEADVLRSQVSGYERDFARDEEIRRLRERIQMLEMQVNSDWARGLTDDPPPSYRA
ncbi:hypothetical protein D9758_009063 [Tetrapyrgos nigripes]|uniref:Uncharacterized protein n=1 Tax=Tetrapyrgos nigripes TaxID=182062 RepID=A0A8H5LKT7_9AGAR|nr:hypothetical protein D9758_009063 [Tetrapyrgos nigripes]